MNMETIPSLVGIEISGSRGLYVIERQIASGTRSNLYRAVWKERTQYVCVKILTFQMRDADVRQMHREETVLSRLDHPNIVRIYDTATIEGFHCTIMELFPDGSLADKLRIGALPLSLTGAVAEQIAAALDYAHSKGIIHLDVKPANILVAGDRFALSDFGIARIVGEQILTGAMNHDGGTPAYMSPEQAMGLHVGASSDQYSLGVVIYEMLTGKRPFHASNSMATLYSIINAPAPSLRALNPSIPIPVEDAVLRALRKAPDRRFGTVTEFASTLNFAIRYPNKAKVQADRVKDGRTRQSSTQKPLDRVFLASLLGSLLGTFIVLAIAVMLFIIFS